MSIAPLCASSARRLVTSEHSKPLQGFLTRACCASFCLAHLPTLPCSRPALGCSKLGAAVGQRLPPMLILHGTADKSVPMEIAIEFVAALKVRWVDCRLYSSALHYVATAKRNPAAAASSMPAQCHRPRSTMQRAAALLLDRKQTMQEAGVANARLKLYQGKTHTKPIVEDPSE